MNYRKDGSAYIVEWLITPVRNADGRITHWVSAQRDVTGRRAFEDRQALMVRELHHRVKNTLATVQAVLNATIRSSVTMPEFARAFTGRIVSLARTRAHHRGSGAGRFVRGTATGRARPLQRERPDHASGAAPEASLGTGGTGQHGLARIDH
ncbi:HWE histidine kinase domain-containing protein [Methylobacterium phyllosphaerae]